jgi:Uncharacterised protein family (UPF0158)
VTDTPPEVMQRYRAMLLGRAPEERLKMGCSMGATAIESWSALRTVAADACGSCARTDLFLRLYGHEFQAVERERILVRLGQDEPRPAGSTKRVPVNWDDLEMALTSNQGEWTCYLDLETGEVRMVPVNRRLIHVDPLGSKVEYRWMAEFTGTVRDARLRDRLEVALDGRGAFRRFKNVLLDFPGQRERWFAFRDERLHAAARDWLGELGIESTTAPPASR